ncbi:MAG: DNA polymerase III subunit alpha [Gammaproteobacteria bacterium]|jgi:DNA polymerase-3 subunit alpha
MQNTFVHLHVHTEYSLIDGLLRIKPLIETSIENNNPAIAVTEFGNLFSLVKFYQLAEKRGVKSIIGAELKIHENETDREASNIVLLCQNLEGYHNLTRLLTKGYLEGQHQGVPHIQRDWLIGNTNSLIALSCGREGNIGKAIINHNHDAANQFLKEWIELFPDRFYLELQRTNRQFEDLYIKEAIVLAEKFDIPVVATNDVRFLEEADFDVHEARYCIQHGYTLNDPRRPHIYSNQQYLKNSEQMCELFQDIPEAIENSFYIAQRCNLDFTFGEYYLPDFLVPDGYDQDTWLISEANNGLVRVLEKHLKNEFRKKEIDRTEYEDRLTLELDVIKTMGFSGYFLIVADFIIWAKKQGIPVGPGRGSGAGSLVAYVLGITELDPLDYDLLFERFLNPERVSLPDFDIDFCMDRRDEVIEYVAGHYGHDHVSQIITFGRMAAKAVIRDVGRVFNHPYGFVDQIAKLVPFDLNMTLARALDEEQLLKQRYKQEDDVKSLIDMALKLEGLSRNAGKHAGGLVIAPKPLTDYMPLYCEHGTNVTSTQLDMGDVETMGLVKFDFLGLRTLTIIDWAVKDINQKLLEDDNINILDIPLDDDETYQLIQRMDTTAVFQLESDGMKKLIRRLHPDVFNDLIAIVALFRPGPMHMVDDFVDRKQGRSKINYLHPSLESILKPTYGVILYQEQVMQIAQVLAGYTLGAADILRRAMGKKKVEEMAEQRNIFVEGAINNNVEKKVATYIFDLMEKFAGYGFNKSHSAAYALLAYQTAWLKAHYPSAFMAAVLSSDMDNTDKIVSLREEINHMKLNLYSPSVNESEYKFTIVGSDSIRFGLGAIKGVGKAAIENIIEERLENGEFSNLFDFCKRIDSRKVNKRVVEALIKSGSADKLGPGRGVMLASLAKAMQLAEQYTSNTTAGQDDMFGLDLNSTTDDNSEVDSKFIKANDLNEYERLKAEKDTLGFYLEGHPITRYENELLSITTTSLNGMSPGVVRVAGYIENIRTRTGQRGRMAELRIDDRTARMMVNLYSDVYEKYRSILQKDKLIIISGEAVEDDYYASGIAIKAEKVMELTEIRTLCGSLILRLDNQMMQNDFMIKIKEVLARYSSQKSNVIVEYKNNLARGVLTLGDEWRVEISDNLLDELIGLIGDENISVEYKDVHKYFTSRPKFKYISGQN